MTLPVIFGPETAAQMSQLDTNFAAVGALTTIQCTATGTNSLVLTPAANQPAVAGYGLPNPLKFGFPAAATSTGAVSLEIGSLGNLPVYTINGVQATSGTLVSGNYYEVTYTTGAIYNSGNGAWVLSSYQPSTGLVVVAGSAIHGLKMTNNAGTPNTKIDFSFQQACLVNATGTPAYLGILSATIDLTTGTVASAANGMDGESRPASGWVYLYAISTGSGMAGLGTLTSPLAGPPTLPAGYSYYAFVGAMYCDGSSNLLRTRQLGNDTQYVVGPATNTANMPQLTTGTTVGSTSIPTWVAVPLGSFVPPTAGTLKFSFSSQTTGGTTIIAPNNSYGSATSTSNPPPVVGQTVSGQAGIAFTNSFILESTNIYWANGGQTTSIWALAWTDYVSAAGGG